MRQEKKVEKRRQVKTKQQREDKKGWKNGGEDKFKRCRKEERLGQNNNVKKRKKVYGREEQNGERKRESEGRPERKGEGKVGRKINKQKSRWEKA